MIFSKFYAECYDQIHSTKQYNHESKRMLNYLEGHLEKKDIFRILDFGCGTGSHLNSLVDNHLELYGYDRNEYMLEVARNKYPGLFVSSNFSSIPGEFDLVYSLFDVVNYQVTEDEVETFFKLISSKLASGGVIVLDGWHYSGVVQDPPRLGERDFNFNSKIITRSVVPSTNDGFQTTVLEISLKDKEKSKILAQESHTMRSFNADELEAIVVKHGFTKVIFKDGANWERDLETNSWRFVLFAEKK